MNSAIWIGLQPNMDLNRISDLVSLQLPVVKLSYLATRLADYRCNAARIRPDLLSLGEHHLRWQKTAVLRLDGIQKSVRNGIEN